MPLLYQQLGQLLERKAVELPQYDYTRDTGAGHTKHQPPVDVIILEGILPPFMTKTSAA